MSLLISHTLSHSVFCGDMPPTFTVGEHRKKNVAKGKYTELCNEYKVVEGV